MMRTLRIMAFGLLVLGLSGVALHADTLALGGNYTNVNVMVYGSSKTLGGGSIGPSSLNSVSLPWVYCVDLFDQIGVPGTYNASVTHDASMTGLTLDSLGLSGYNSLNGSGTVNHADEVAYLLQNYAAGATSTDQQAALQAAIWYVIYNGNVSLNMSNSDDTRKTDYETYITGIGSGNVANFSWLSPGKGLQGLVTAGSTPVPDGGMTLMLLGGTLVGIGSLRRKFHV